jgi:hypothetical protein
VIAALEPSVFSRHYSLTPSLYRFLCGITLMH